MGKRGRRRGCLGWGCLVVGGLLLAIVLSVGWIAAVQYRLPERLGLRKSPAERLLSGEPSRAAELAFEEDLAEAGVNTQGLGLYVLPVEGRDYNILVAVLDAAQGFRFERVRDEDAVLTCFRRLAATGAVEDFGVQRVVLHYLDAEGEAKLSVTAPIDAIRRYSKGEIDREEFMQAMEARMDLQALAGVEVP